MIKQRRHSRPQPQTSRIARDVKSAFYDHAAFIALIVFYVGLVFLIARSAGLDARFETGLYQQPHKLIITM